MNEREWCMLWGDTLWVWYERLDFEDVTCAEGLVDNGRACVPPIKATRGGIEGFDFVCVRGEGSDSI